MTQNPKRPRPSAYDQALSEIRTAPIPHVADDESQESTSATPVQQGEAMQPSAPIAPQRPLPPATRVRTRIPFEQRYQKETINVDKRLMPFFFRWIERGPSKTALMNEAILDALLKAGFDVPPDILKQPFTDNPQ